MTGDEVVVLADSRYTIQAAPRGARGADLQRLQRPAGTLARAARVGRARSGSRSRPASSRRPPGAGSPPRPRRSSWSPVDGWVEADRAIKEPAELERVAAACAVADRALATLLPEIRPGVTEAELALRLEWLIRTGGAEALAFDVACLSGPEAALPHGSPGDRPVLDGTVLLFDFGAQVAGYRSDMTRTLFVGEPSERDLEVYGLVAHRAADAIEPLDARRSAPGHGAPLPSGRAIDAAARDVIEAAGHGEHFGHGTGHGIGLATHESPSLGRFAPDTPLPSPTVFSVEPGVYLEGEMGVRIEDLVLLDAAAGRGGAADALPAGGHRRRLTHAVAWTTPGARPRGRPARRSSATIAARSPDGHPGARVSRDRPVAVTPGAHRMISTGELKKGVAIELDGELWQILDYHHIKMGRGSAQVRITLRNIKRGQTVERSFQAGTKWPRASMEKRPVQFLYRDGDDYHFMDTDTYDQFVLSGDQLGDTAPYLKDGMTLDRTSYQGETIGVELPVTVDLTVVDTEPGFAGDTQSGARKPATTETGLVVQVPIFVGPGDTIRVDTRTGEYQTRV